jgi:hypothetical protein
MEAWQKQAPQSSLPNGVIDKTSFPSGPLSTQILATHILATQILATLSIADGPPPVSEGLKLRTEELSAMWAKFEAEGTRLLDDAGPNAVRQGAPLRSGPPRADLDEDDETN